VVFGRATLVSPVEIGGTGEIESVVTTETGQRLIDRFRRVACRKRGDAPTRLSRESWDCQRECGAAENRAARSACTAAAPARCPWRRPQPPTGGAPFPRNTSRRPPTFEDEPRRSSGPFGSIARRACRAAPRP
jgi:hypothetical protein